MLMHNVLFWKIDIPYYPPSRFLCMDTLPVLRFLEKGALAANLTNSTFSYLHFLKLSRVLGTKQLPRSGLVRENYAVTFRKNDPVIRVAWCNSVIFSY